MEWSSDQSEAIERIESWRKSSFPTTFSLGGLAGTGKTTLITHFINTWPSVAVCSFAGKAAAVLRSRGVYQAKTIHSLIYLPEEQPDGTVKYIKRDRLDDVSTIVVDEASMVNRQLMSDLSSFGIPILFVGDHGQLEPIGDNPGIMLKPDVRLERIHRQAAGNPIIEIAHCFRNGKKPDWTASVNSAGHVQRIKVNQLAEYLTEDVQWICGFNNTRRRINNAIRKRAGRTALVTEGERIIVLRNSRDFGVFNGQQFTVKDILRTSERSTRVVAADDQGETVLTLFNGQFGRDKLDDRSQDCVFADYAYCVTAHKAQGSEFPTVCVYEEIAEVWDKRRWRYTVATRAKDRLIYHKPVKGF